MFQAKWLPRPRAVVSGVSDPQSIFHFPLGCLQEPQARADLSLSNGGPVFIITFPFVTCKLTIDRGFVPQPRIAGERLK